jgi:hypothetical protein
MLQSAGMFITVYILQLFPFPESFETREENTQNTISLSISWQKYHFEAQYYYRCRINNILILPFITFYIIQQFMGKLIAYFPSLKLRIWYGKYQEFAWLIRMDSGLMIGFLALLSELKSIVIAHNQWPPKTCSIPYWTTSVLSSATTALVLIQESVISSASTAEHWISHDEITTESLNSLELN